MIDSHRRQILSSTLRAAAATGLGLGSMHGVSAKDSLANADENIPARNLARIIKSGQLVAGFPSFDEYPFFYTKDGVSAGMEVDLASRFCKSLNLELKIDRSANTYNDMVEMVGENRLDIAFHLVPTFRRVKRVSFSNAFVIFPHSLIVNRVEIAKIGNGATLEQTLQNYKGTVGILAGSAQEELAVQSFPDATIVRFPTWEQTVDAVVTGKVVFAYRNEFYIRKILIANPSLSLILKAVSFNDLLDHLSIAVSHDNKILKELLNQFVSQRAGQLNINSILSRIERG